MAVAFYVGAYTADMGGTATGIAALGRLADGSLENLGLATVADSPSYLAAAGDLVYAAAEATGRIEVFRRDGELALEPVASADSGGVAPCHVARYGDTLVAACYVDGTLGVLSAEPLPDGHPLWHEPRCIITSHSADTKAMTRPLLAGRISVNVQALLGDGRFVGVVDTEAGY